ncbi:GMC oxidoreductase [Rhodococcus pyridinivorans]|uniref:GMC oxidoreductase n=1 Tax=Rhodococcus pyridinivorans TaxID=103816 RepID=UPI00089BED2D|nr:GMC oxidoreductase [Rhodococcus pyridinivorans]SED77639.1 GMC oxidoreductase [Rhodococcus pyridinivorans]
MESAARHASFLRIDNPDKRFLWHRSNPEVFGRHLAFEPYTGLVEACVGENMTALCAAGVGGGSLVYQGMTLQPDEAVFNAHFPNELDWARMDRVHYPRVAQMLHLAVAPDELVDSPNYATSRIFADRARKAGFPIDKIPMPIDWDYALAELRDEMAPAYTDGSGAIGVNNGGKHSVDVTYIAEAEATGLVTVAKDLISDLPDGVGHGWGSNADRIYLWTNLEEEFGAVQGGPVVYGSKNWDDPNSASTVIQASIPGFYGIDMRSTVLVGYGVSEGRGHFVYDAARDDAVLRWPHEGDAVLQTGHIDPTVRRIAGERSILTDTNSIVPSTWHPLGGASMSTVCDLEGRVFGQRGLYVLDGALMPGNTAACNPSMTIAAVVERALDDIVVRDVGTVF